MKINETLATIEPSYIREILKAANSQQVVSFAGGLPATETFATHILQPIFEGLTQHRELFQYGQTQGYEPLLSFLKERYNVCLNNDLLITNGSQQGLDLIARAFINPQDIVVVEAHSYIGALQVFKLAQAKLLSIEQLESGPDLEELEKAFRENDVKFFYFMADFHNPTGICYTLEIRERIAKLCKTYKVAMIEDTPYRALRFIGKQLPLVSSFYIENSFILRSFSKEISPGMRLGVVECANERIQILVKLKQITDLHSNTPLQYVLFKLLSDNGIEQHINNLTDIYQQKHDFMIERLYMKLKDKISVKSVEGGMFIWLKIKSRKLLDMEVLAKDALSQNLAIVPSCVFRAHQQQDNAIRLNFSHPSLDEISIGVDRLASIINKALMCNKI